MTAPTVLGRRIFTLADQREFAALSGDWNPAHLDPVTARRTLFGEPVVHGIHLVLWAMETLVAEQSSALAIRTLRARFRKPAYLDREVTLVEREHGVAATTDEGSVLDLVCAFEPRTYDDVTPAERTWPEAAPAELDFDHAAHASGEAPLVLDPHAFPRSRAVLGRAAIAELLALTRIVGMQCPGLHSVLAGFELGAASGGPTVRYEVAQAKPSYSTITLRVAGPRLAGTVETFFRPAPTSVAMTDAVARVRPDAFVGRRALVVGGSRGLGEAFAKALAAGGAEVCVTYVRGADDARRVVDDIASCGSRATAIQFDVAAPDELATRWPLAGPPTHLYYFATPTLRLAVPFRAHDLDLMMRTYVTGLHTTIAAAISLGAPSLVVWTPSSTLLDESVRVAPAYCIAKAAMEELCRQLPAMFPVTVHAPRLGRLETDHPPALVKIPRASTLAVAIEQLRSA